MDPTPRLLFTAALLLVAGATAGSAEVEQRLARSIRLPDAAVDVAATADGQRTYVLLANGTVQIYDGGGTPLGTLTLGNGARAIAPSPDGSLLYATVGDELQVVAVDMVYQLDVAGSPVRGPAEAPVTVAVFNDFQ
ncbi:MAG: hypothetical protein P1P84_05780 [Deferrisomatales bacterium]|nr:hypothetical protein [Deferrisomatales bacterium]